MKQYKSSDIPIDFVDAALLVALRDSKSLTKTSAQFGMAIINIRRRVGKVEGYFQQKIYKRTAAGVEFTSFGMQLAAYLEETYERLSLLRSSIESSLPIKNIFSIAGIQGITEEICGEIIKKVRKGNLYIASKHYTFNNIQEIVETYPDIFIYHKDPPSSLFKHYETIPLCEMIYGLAHVTAHDQKLSEDLMRTHIVFDNPSNCVMKDINFPNIIGNFKDLIEHTIYTNDFQHFQYLINNKYGFGGMWLKKNVKVKENIKCLKYFPEHTLNLNLYYNKKTMSLEDLEYINLFNE